ncbi:MAG: MoaD/ThiS family protein [Phycisphaerae bacterium]
MIRLVLPFHLRTLARITGEVQLEVAPPVTQRGLLDALEAAHPVLRGTIRDHGSEKRRPMIRFYACQEDLSNDPPDAPLPLDVVSGKEPFLVVAAIAGG